MHHSRGLSCLCLADTRCFTAFVAKTLPLSSSSTAFVAALPPKWPGGGLCNQIMQSDCAIRVCNRRCLARLRPAETALLAVATSVEQRVADRHAEVRKAALHQRDDQPLADLYLHVISLVAHQRDDQPLADLPACHLFGCAGSTCMSSLWLRTIAGPEGRAAHARVAGAGRKNDPAISPRGSCLHLAALFELRIIRPVILLLDRSIRRHS